MWNLYSGLEVLASIVLCIFTSSPVCVCSGGLRRMVGVSQFLAQCSYPCALLKCVPVVLLPRAVARSGVFAVRVSRCLCVPSGESSRRTHMAKDMEFSSPAVVMGTWLVVVWVV